MMGSEEECFLVGSDGNAVTTQDAQVPPHAQLAGVEVEIEGQTLTIYKQVSAENKDKDSVRKQKKERKGPSWSSARCKSAVLSLNNYAPPQVAQWSRTPIP